MSQTLSEKVLQNAPLASGDKSELCITRTPLDNNLQLPYTTTAMLDGDGRIWLRLGTTRRCFGQIVNGRIVYRMRDVKLDGSVPGISKRGKSISLDTVVLGARAQIQGDSLVITLPLIPNQDREP